MVASFLRLHESFKRESAITFACTAVAAALIAGFATLEMVNSYHEVMRAGRSRGANLVRLLEEQTRRTLQAIDFSLQDISTTLRDAPNTAKHDAVVTARMRSRLSDLPYVRALFVIGADGFLIQDTDSDTPNVSLADRDYFQVHQGHPGEHDGLFIGRPLRSRSIGAPWFLSVSRRIALPTGEFYGVAVAALEPRYFARFYGDISVGPGGSLALVHSSGIVIARYPEHEGGVGLSLADTNLFIRQLPVSDSGSFRDLSRLDRVDRLYTYRRSSPLPLVVVVGLGNATLLSDWWGKLVVTGLAAAVVILMLTFGSVLLVRHRRSELLAAERLQEIDKIEALALMSTSVAHDFNNLLMVISLNLELAIRRISQDDAANPRLTIALDAVGRAKRVVGQLLAFARAETGTVGRQDVVGLVEGMSELLRQAASPCELAIVAPNGLWECMIFPNELERAILNLVVNARDASGRHGRIEIALANVPHRALDHAQWPDLAPGDYVSCQVRDHGAGMSSEVVRRACEPFFTTKGKGLGTGLGLSQVFQCARRSGGGLRIDSEPGVGTTIRLLLPRAVDGANLHPAVSGDSHEYQPTALK